jgi:hypothetical protein
MRRCSKRPARSVLQSEVAARINKLCPSPQSLRPNARATANINHRPRLCWNLPDGRRNLPTSLLVTKRFWSRFQREPWFTARLSFVSPCIRPGILWPLGTAVGRYDALRAHLFFAAAWWRVLLLIAEVAAERRRFRIAFFRQVAELGSFVHRFRPLTGKSP